LRRKRRVDLWSLEGRKEELVGSWRERMRTKEVEGKRRRRRREESALEEGG